MADGSIVFNVELDNEKAIKQLSSLEAKIKKLEDALGEKRSAQSAIQAELKSASLEAQKTERVIDGLTSKIAQMENIRDNLGIKNPVGLGEAQAELKQQQGILKAQNREVEQLHTRYTKITDSIISSEKQMSDLKNQTKMAMDQLKKSAPASTAMRENMDKASASAVRFRHRLIEIGKSAVVFNLVSAGLRSAMMYIGNMLKTNAAYVHQLALLKGALLTAFQPIYEYALPGLIAVLRILTAIVSVVANVLSSLFGKTASQSADSAEALHNQATALGGVAAAAKEAKKQLMGFDEINKLDSEEKNTGGGGSVGGVKPDFSEFDTNMVKDKVDELTVYLSGALLALGAILAFSGVNILLGIALMAVGAIGLVSVIKENWGAMSESTKKAIANVALILGTAALVIGAILAFSGIKIGLGIALMVIGASSMAAAAAMNWGSLSDSVKSTVRDVFLALSGALLALGAILAFSGANIPLGIGLMAAGALSLAAAAAMDWGYFKTNIKSIVTDILLILSTTLLVLGAVLAFSGANIPLGVALIAAGAAGLVTVTAINWNAILDKLKGVWNGIKQWFNSSVAPYFTLSYWVDKFSSIGEGLKQAIKDGINGAIVRFNSFISFINSAMHFSWGGVSAFGKTIIPPGEIQLLTIPHIPYLAKGAVIPPNAPFMAMLGDQRHGTNIEAPLSTIEEAVAKVTASAEQIALLREQNRLLQAILENSGVYLDGKKLSETVTKYQRQRSRALGV